MTILLMPTHQCHNRCVYCFEDLEQVREFDDTDQLDVQAMINTAKRMNNTSRWGGSTMGMHGGECTHIDRHSFEALLKAMYEMTGESSIQTAGNYLQPWMVRVFKEYNTSVGISVDGPYELNTLRGPNPGDGNIRRTYQNTIENWLKRLPREGVSTSAMVVLHTENVGTNEKLETLKDWLLQLRTWGVKAGRLNPMYAASWNKQYELSCDRLAYVYADLFDFVIEHGLRWNPLREMVDALLGYGPSPCTFTGCEYYPATTTAILPDGSIGQCDRTFQEGRVLLVEERDESGIYMRNPDGTTTARKIRNEALSQTECKDCRYWTICHGGCPAEALDDDWRRKSRFCEAYMATYDHIDMRLHRMFPNVITVLDDPDVFESLGRLTYWGSTKPSHYGAAPVRDGAELYKRQLGTNSPIQPSFDGHGNRPHGDKPHGDHMDDIRGD